MAFKLFSRGRKKQTGADPLAAYDALIEDLDRQGAEVRRSAAALLTVRGELTRAAERYEKRLSELDERLSAAHGLRDDKAKTTLERDRVQARKLLDTTRESLARVEVDAELLKEAAQELSAQAHELRTERTSAQARLTAGLVVQEALRERSARISQALALDAARDEIERAHALAEIYREERGKKP